MSRTTFYTPIWRNSSDYIFWITNAALTFVLSWYAPVLAQELYTLSTDSGMEFYQVQAVKKLHMNVNTSHSALWPQSGNGALSSGINVNSRLTPHSTELDPGFQTTVNGRILTMAGRIDWKPTGTEIILAEEFNQSPKTLGNIPSDHVAWGRDLNSSMIVSR